MAKVICAADDCDEQFEPKIIGQMYCSDRCAVRTRVRRYRARRKNSPDGGGPRGPHRLPPRNQLGLFAATGKKSSRRATQTDLFRAETPHHKAATA